MVNIGSNMRKMYTEKEILEIAKQVTPPDKKLYLHQIKIGDAYVHIYNFDSTPFTDTTLKAWLVTNGFTDTTKIYPVDNSSKYLRKVNSTVLGFSMGIFNLSGTLKIQEVTLEYAGGWGTIGYNSKTDSFVSDNVIEM